MTMYLGDELIKKAITGFVQAALRHDFDPAKLQVRSQYDVMGNGEKFWVRYGTLEPFLSAAVSMSPREGSIDRLMTDYFVDGLAAMLAPLISQRQVSELGLVKAPEPPEAKVMKLLQHGTPQTLFTNLLELADKGHYKEAIIITLDQDELLEFHCSALANNFKAVGMVEFLKRYLMEK